MPEGELYYCPHPAALAIYFTAVLELMSDLRKSEVDVVVIKLPLRNAFYELIPGEAEFDERIAALLEEHEVPFYNYSVLDFDSELFYDPDHLNREGVEYFLHEHFAPVLQQLLD